VFNVLEDGAERKFNALIVVLVLIAALAVLAVMNALLA
jgi:hypothetical protein